MRFSNRAHAGAELSKQLQSYVGEHPIVLALPRGGVPVAREVAQALRAPLDVWVVRKVGAPMFPELGLGAVAEGGVVYLNRNTMEQVGVDDEDVQTIVQKKQAEVAERVTRFRGRGRIPDVRGRTVILVDDGIATGGTVHAAAEAIRAAGAFKVVLATPVASIQSLRALAPLFDEVVAVIEAEDLGAVGEFYEDFRQVSDDEVLELLAQSRRPSSSRVPASHVEMEVEIPVSSGSVNGTLTVPRGANGLVIFAHGSGSSRFSPRNRHVAEMLQRKNLATLLFDLLTRGEERQDEVDGSLRFDIGLLAGRLLTVAEWVRTVPELSRMRIGYFGSSTGAAAALTAAAERPELVDAVVSRGGRPDLAGARLSSVRAPTLLIVGGEDDVVIDLNRAAYARLSAEKELIIVPGATHLFEEPGTLDAVAGHAADWFVKKLVQEPSTHAPSAL